MVALVFLTVSEAVLPSLVMVILELALDYSAPYCDRVSSATQGMPPLSTVGFA